MINYTFVVRHGVYGFEKEGAFIPLAYQDQYKFSQLGKKYSHDQFTEIRESTICIRGSIGYEAVCILKRPIYKELFTYSLN